LTGGLERRVIEAKGIIYWNEWKDKILSRANKNGRLNVLSKTNNRAERRKNLLSERYDQLDDCIEDLRRDGWTFKKLAFEMGIPRSTLYRYRKRTVKRADKVREMVEFCQAI
jgi:hypothetical protein